jgi:hypothetical protein
MRYVEVMVTTRPAPVAPEWLVPGVEVLVVRGHWDERVTKTTVAKVHKRYFTVDYRMFADCRFSLDRQEHRGPGMWGVTRKVIPLDGDEARSLIDADRRRRLEDQARKACEQWIVSRKRDDRLAAVAALQAVEDET